MISQIAAMSQNMVIGVDNKLPRHYPEDFKHFKKHTLEKPILMWRKTFESIWRPLPKRRNIVLTRNTERSHEWVEVVHDIKPFIQKYHSSEEELMVIWGSQIYRLFLPYTDQLYLTEVKIYIDWDAYFPKFKHDFKETDRIERDEFDFVWYKRKD